MITTILVLINACLYAQEYYVNDSTGHGIIFRTTRDGKMVVNRATSYDGYCKLPNFRLDDVDTLATFKGNLTKFFSKHIDWQQLDKIAGVVYIQVLVDSTGHICCKAISHQTLNNNETVNDLQLHSIIEQMPPWQPAIENGKPINTSTLLQLRCRIKGEPMFHVTYQRVSSKWRKAIAEH